MGTLLYSSLHTSAFFYSSLMLESLSTLLIQFPHVKSVGTAVIIIILFPRYLHVRSVVTLFLQFHHVGSLVPYFYSSFMLGLWYLISTVPRIRFMGTLFPHGSAFLNIHIGKSRYKSPCRHKGIRQVMNTTYLLSILLPYHIVRKYKNGVCIL